MPLVSKQALQYPSWYKFSSVITYVLVILYFIIRPVILFELIFVKGVRSVFTFIFLCVDVPLIHYSLLKRLSLLHRIAFALWAHLYSIPLIRLSVFLQTPHCVNY